MGCSYEGCWWTCFQSVATRRLCVIMGTGCSNGKRRKLVCDNYRGGAPSNTGLLEDSAEILNTQE